MAFDLFSVSPKYLKESQKGSRARRQMLLSYLDDQYQPQRSYEFMIERLQSAGHVRVSKINIRNDISLYRAAYQYLTGDGSVRERLEQRLAKKPVDPTLTGLRYLLADGIKRWSDIPKEKLAEYKISLQQQSPSQPLDNQQQPPEAADDKLAEVNNLFVQLAEKFRALSEENRTLAVASENQAREIERLQGESSRLRQQLLEMQTQQARKALSDLDLLIRQAGDPELIASIDNIRDKLHHQRAEKDKAIVLAELPKHASFGGNVPVVPSESFLSDLDALQPDERKQVIKSLVLLCNQGPKHPSLKTGIMLKPYRQTPYEASHSRASSELRVTWTLLTRRKVVLHNIFRRGEIGWSEA